MKQRLLHIVAIVWGLSLWSCSSIKKSASTNTSQIKTTAGKTELTEKERMKAGELFFDGNKQKILGNTEEAVGLFRKSLGINPNNHAALYELAGVLGGMEKVDEAIPLTKKAIELDTENVWYKVRLAELYRKAGKHEKAAEVYEQIINDHPSKVEFYFDMAYTLLFANKLPEAIAVYDRLESVIGIDKEISISKHKIYLQLNNYNKAIEELNKLLKKTPRDPEVYFLLSGTYIDQEKWDTAVDMLKKVLEFESQNGMVNLYLSDIYEKKGEAEKSKEELKIAFESPNVEIDLKIKKLDAYLKVLSLNPDLKDFVFELADIMVDTHPDDPKAFSMMGDLLYQDEQLVEARENFRNALALNQGIFLIWNQVLVIDQQLLDFESMNKESQEAMDLFPSQPVFYFYNGFAKVQQKDYDAAVEILEIGKDLVADNELLLIQFYSTLGDAYHELKQHQQSDEAYDESLKLDPDNIYVLNNYSYYLSLRENNLEKAEKMSLKSNQLRPDNASFQDTYGWILYKSQKYEESEKWLKMAVENGGMGNGVILEHYGDVLFKLGRKDSALEFWNRAKSAGSSSEMLDKKIADKMLYE